MIVAKKVNEIQESWGIEVVVQFTDIGIDITKTFRFDDEEQIANEVEARMTKAITNIENKIAESKKPMPDDIVERLKEHFETNATITKTEYANIENTELAVIHG